MPWTGNADIFVPSVGFDGVSLDTPRQRWHSEDRGIQSRWIDQSRPGYAIHWKLVMSNCS